MKSGFLDKLIERIRRVQTDEGQNYLIRLAQGEGFLEGVFVALPGGGIVIDGQGKIQFFKVASRPLFCVEPEETRGKPIDDFLRGLSWTSLRSSEGTVSRDIELFYPQHRFLNFYVAPLHLDKAVPESAAMVQDLVAFAVILRDITEDRRTTERTIESEKLSALTMLAAGVAHEIGNPLNSLNIHLQLIQTKIRRVASPVRDSIEELLEVARTEIQRLDSIIHQFLQAIRPTRPSFEPHDLNEIIEESVAFLRREIEDRDILVETDLAAGLPRVEVDRDQMKQAFYNVIKNAFEAMRIGGILHIRSWRDDIFVSIAFTDTGGRLSGQDMSKLLRPYFTTKPSGSGLGLLIVRRIVREHGGEVEIESNKAKGAEVAIQSPYARR